MGAVMKNERASIVSVFRLPFVEAVGTIAKILWLELWVGANAKEVTMSVLGYLANDTID